MRIFGRITAAFLILAIAFYFTGCGKVETSKPEATEPRVLRPEGVDIEFTKSEAGVERVAVTFENGQVDYFKGDELFSPDFKWAAFSGTENGFGQGLWIFAVDGSDARLVEKIQGEDFESGAFRLWLLGWDNGGSLIYAVSGKFKEGKHQGKEGLIFKKYNPESEEAKEIGRLPLKDGYWSGMMFNRAHNLVFVDVISEIWKVDVAEGVVSPLKGGLPSYDGLFYPRLSPSGEYFAYEKYEPDVPGIYILDTKSGEEKILAKGGKVIQFLPLWSPDGRHIAYYSAGKDSEGGYDLIQGENYPYPLGDFIEVVNVKTGSSFRIEIPDKKVGFASWSYDGTSLLFCAISKEKAEEIKEIITNDAQEINNISWDGLYIAELEGNIKEVAKGIKTPVTAYLSKDKSAVYFADSDALSSGDLLYLPVGRGKVKLNPGEVKKWIVNDYGIAEYKGNPVIAAYLQDGTFRLFIFEDEKAKDVFSESGSLWRYTVVGDYLVLSYTTKENQKERLEFIKLKD
ncbi:MAG: hypothetical protein L5655_03075 [Thermosediminibacteraceae bacterium]|nr:hypothetical protein [Thermosediminibacteraceae bacterium]